MSGHKLLIMDTGRSPSPKASEQHDWWRSAVIYQVYPRSFADGNGDDPRDSSSIDRLLRWFIARPITLILVIVIGLTALFVLLVSLGSPTEWFD